MISEEVREKGGEDREGCFLFLEPGKKFHVFIAIQLNAQALGTSAQDTCAGFKVAEAGPCPQTIINLVRETTRIDN